jgi:hypothetical protein
MEKAEEEHRRDNAEARECGSAESASAGADPDYGDDSEQNGRDAEDYQTCRADSPDAVQTSLG